MFGRAGRCPLKRLPTRNASRLMTRPGPRAVPAAPPRNHVRPAPRPVRHWIASTWNSSFRNCIRLQFRKRRFAFCKRRLLSFQAICNTQSESWRPRRKEPKTTNYVTYQKWHASWIYKPEPGRHRFGGSARSPQAGHKTAMPHRPKSRKQKLPSARRGICHRFHPR